MVCFWKTRNICSSERGNGNPVGKDDVMKAREEAHTGGYFTADYIRLCGMSITTTQVFYGILFPLVSFNYPSPFYGNRLGSDEC